MFQFYRTRTGLTEVFEIIIPNNSLPNAYERFGKPLRYNRPENFFHNVGTLILIHDENKDEVEFFIAWRGKLAESELSILIEQLEHLAGKEIHMLGAEPASGYFLHDSLKDR